LRTCKHCYTKITYKQMLKRQFTLSDGIVCPRCGETQYYSKRTRVWSGSLTIGIITLVMLGNLFFGPSYIAVVMLLLFLPLFLLIFPLYVELANERNLPF